ncbi:MAG: M48 family metallopeptidase [Alphaproteobacteria bacterium]|nr:M48 family metallopeptidase [Alphaproteobacteria bacterium]
MFIAVMWAAFLIAAFFVDGADPLQFATEHAIMVSIPTAVACLVWMLISWMFGDSMILSAANAKELSNRDPDYKYLYKEVENVALAAGLPTPRVYIIEEAGANAFATGRSPGDASVAFTRGIVERLDARELRGVIAHELAHVQNRDIRLDMLLITGIGATIFAANILARSMFFRGRGGGNRNDGRVMLVIMAAWAGLMVFNFLIAPLLRKAISRTREYSADATGALMTRDPKALASALEKISKNPKVAAVEGKSSMNAMFIAEPFAKLAGLYSTHPSIKSRVARLEKM